MTKSARTALLGPALLLCAAPVSAQVWAPPPPPPPGAAPPYRAPPPPGRGAGWSLGPYAQPPPPGYAAPPPYGQAPPSPYVPPPGYAPLPPVASAPTSESHDYADDQSAMIYDIISLRVGSYRLRGTDADATTTGFLVAFDPDVNVVRDHATVRLSSYAAIGGGSGGLEGQIEQTLTAGVRGYLGDDHGPFARLGLGFQVLGNNKIYRSSFELPVVEAGYQLFNDDVLIEAGARSGLVLGGRYNVGDDSHRRIDTEPELGGFFTLQAEPFRAQASFTRTFARQTLTGTPIDQASGAVCAALAEVFYLCGNAAHHRGDVRLPDGAVREASALYLGGTIAIGVIKNK